MNLDKIIAIGFAILAIPTLIYAIIRSIALIHTPIVLENFQNEFMQIYGGYVIYGTLLIATICAIATIIIFLVHIGTMGKRGLPFTPEGIQFVGNLFLAGTSILSLTVIWFIAKASDPSAPFEWGSLSLGWFIALAISIVSFSASFFTTNTTRRN